MQFYLNTLFGWSLKKYPAKLTLAGHSISIPSAKHPNLASNQANPSPGTWLGNNPLELIPIPRPFAHDPLNTAL